MTVRLVISGWTAAGKSTHGRLLSDDLGLPYVSATEVLAGLVAARTATPALTRWHPSLDEARGSDRSIDDELDSILGASLRRSEGVFDACLLPWVERDVPAVRVWIDSDYESRVRKCLVSHLGEDVDEPKARRRVQSKDDFTQERLRVTCGLAYSPNTADFHVIANNTMLIPEATAEAANAGISRFRGPLLDAVRYAAGLTGHRPSSEYLTFARRATRTSP